MSSTDNDTLRDSGTDIRLLITYVEKDPYLQLTDLQQLVARTQTLSRLSKQEWRKR